MDAAITLLYAALATSPSRVGLAVPPPSLFGSLSAPESSGRTSHDETKAGEQVDTSAAEKLLVRCRALLPRARAAGAMLTPPTAEVGNRSTS